jgi:predicted DNA-binding transcriptional regulator AlpA
MTEHFGTSPKKGRGRSAKSNALIKAMYKIAEATKPITGRGVGYKLFTQKLIPSMSRKSMRIVYRLLLLAREEGIIPWEWIVDETRSAERVATWKDPEAYSRAVANSYRRCTAVGISLSFFYELKQAGLAPRAMKLGTRRIISVEEAQKWCRERTEASGKVVREARQP